MTSAQCLHCWYTWQDETPNQEPCSYTMIDHHYRSVKSRFAEEIRSALTKAGLPPQDYADHSFQIGAATTVETVGIQDSAIQILGR